MERKPYSGNTARGNMGAASSRAGSVSRTPRQAQRSAPANAQHSRPSGRPYPNGYAKAPERSYSKASPARPAQANPAPKSLPAKQGKPRFGFPHFAVLAVILFLLIYFGGTWLSVVSNQKTFCSNLYINDIELDKYTREAALNLLSETADARLNTRYTLNYGIDSWSFTAADFGGSIDFESAIDRAWNLGHVGGMFDRKTAIDELKKAPVHFTVDLVYDDSKLDAFVDEIYNAIYAAPIDAQVTITTDRPVLTTESSTGRELDREFTREQIVSLVETGVGETALKVDITEPAISSGNAGALDVIVEYSTDVSFRGYNSRFNVRKALASFDYLCVYPGDIVNFNDMVGPRTESRGWLEAPEYAGKTVINGFGGGTCQASTTLYGAAMLAGMDILQRFPHGMTVTYTDPSLDAAVTDTGKNLIFQNNTDHAIYIYTKVTAEKATVTIYGNRPDYQYKLQSKLLTQENYCTNESFTPDTEAKHVYYTTETKLQTAGRPACTSEGWLIAYDWNSGAEVSRKQLSYDIYDSGTNIYWQGIHDPVTGLPVTTQQPS